MSSSHAVGGGCINEAFRLQGAQRSVFLKLNRADQVTMFEAEAAGLLAIRDSQSLRVPEPIAWGIVGNRSWLALEFVDFGSAGRRTHTLLGERLAALHHGCADRFGWNRNNTIGATPQPNPWTTDWVAFLQQQRIGFQLALAANNGMSRAIAARGEQLLEALPALFDDYRPQPSLLHGDLWGGNWAADRDGNPVIFDPAVYFGDRESDIAMTELFGGFDERFYAAYRSAWPLDPGYPVRRQLYQLYHVLNHFNLFGAGYAGQAGQLIDGLLSELAG